MSATFHMNHLLRLQNPSCSKTLDWQTEDKQDICSFVLGVLRTSAIFPAQGSYLWSQAVWRMRVMRTRAGQQSKHTQHPRRHLTIRIITIMTAILINSKTISPHITYALQLNEHGLIKPIENHQLGTSAVYKDSPSILISDTGEVFNLLRPELLQGMLHWFLFVICKNKYLSFCIM